jgi:hypothetical protein
MLAALLLSGCAASVQAEDVAPSQAPSGFWAHWGDGKAELAGYRLAQPRYGVVRRGEAVHVTVTEDFTRASRVKSDGGHRDEYPVLKLNAVRDFQTGIYDYNVLTSAFLSLDGSSPLGVPTKVSFSAQEWCGHAYEQLVVDDGAMRRTLHSYFDGEADKDDRHDVPAGGVFADALPLLVRGLVGDLVKPGETRTVPFLPSALDRRLTHRPLKWTTATLRRSRDAEEVTVPAGTFSTYTVLVTPTGGVATTFWIEETAPHLLVRWRRPDGEEGELTGVMRSAYWMQNGEGMESLRAKLGLGPPSFPARP